MSAPSPALQSGSLVTFTVKAEGKATSSAFEIASIDTWSAVNRVPRARLVIYDGAPAEADFPISSLDTFLPGKRVSIAAGYNGKESVVFEGIVVGQGLEIDRDSASRLVVDLADRALGMTLERKNAVFEKKKDSDVIRTLLSGNGLSGSVDATATTYEDIVQFYATDWDTMVMRAELNGFVVVTEGGKLAVGKPDTQAAPSLTIAYGQSILDLDAQMSAATQYAASAIKSYAWDSATQKVVEASPGGVSVKEPGNVSSEQLAKVFGAKAFAQQTSGEVPSEGLKAWSSAELLRSRLSKLRGRVRFQGNALAKTGGTIELDGLGGRFNGVVYVSAVHHRLVDGLWTTTATFGLSQPWFASETPDVAAPGASGQLPPVQGLQTGVVHKLGKDPEGGFRVQVRLPLLGAAAKPVWARFSSFYASKGIGAAFYPEVGDEVVVGFMNDDPRYPVILGSLYGKKLAPPNALPDDKNNVKAIVTRGKLEMSFDDEGKIIEIKTPKKRTVKLDDKAGTITVADGAHRIVLSSSGIAIESGKDLTLSAKGAITVKAGTSLALSGATETSLKGSQVTVKASAALKASGSMAELSASGIAAVKGAMVNIN